MVDAGLSKAVLDWCAKKAELDALKGKRGELENEIDGKESDLRSASWALLNNGRGGQTLMYCHSDSPSDSRLIVIDGTHYVITGLLTDVDGVSAQVVSLEE